MLNIPIPGRRPLELSDLVLDYNGTLALDGSLLPGVAERLGTLAKSLGVHVLTADTHGTVAGMLAGLPVRLTVIAPGGQALAKRDFVEGLGAAGVAAMGNGANDRLMLACAALGVLVIGPEGATGAAVAAADVVVTGILAGLDLLLNPLRLAATLRD